MLVSPFFSLANFLLVPLLIYSSGLTAATIEQAIPVFNKTICEKDTNVFCIVPKSCGSGGDLKILTSDDFHTDCGDQIILRFYTTKKILVEIWAKGTSAELKDHEGKTIFGCAPSADGGDRASTTLSGASLDKNYPKVGNFTSENIYCRFVLLSTTNIFFPFQTIDALNQKLTFVATSSYETTRAVLSPMATVHCDYNLIKKDQIQKRSGYSVKDIPYANLFAKTITCPENAVMIFDQGRNSKIEEAFNITCIRTSNSESLPQYEFSINQKSGRSKNIKDKDNKFNIGCQYQDCKMCLPSNFTCQASDCDIPREIPTSDGCKVFKCPNLFVRINEEPKPINGEIKCSKFGETDHDWAINGIRAKTAFCPKELRCRDVSNFTCHEDEKCSATLDGLDKLSVKCKDDKLMTITHSGTNTSTTGLVCNTATGRYKFSGDDGNLLDESIIHCEAKPVAPPTDTAASKGSTTVYVAAATGGVFVVIGLAVIIFCCCKKLKQKRPGKVAVTATTTTTKIESTTTRKSQETLPKATTPIAAVQTVPIPPPTPIQAGGHPTAATPWDLTEGTPRPPTPIAEQQTQHLSVIPAKTKSDSFKSTPMEPPRDDSAAAAHQPSEPSRSGVERKDESTKKTDYEDDVYTRRSEEPRNRNRKRRETSRHGSRDLVSNNTQNEESTKRTQNESRNTKRTQDTKKTQGTQGTVSRDEGEGGEVPSIPDKVPAKISTKMPPKKTKYVGLAEAENEHDSYDSDKDKKRPDNKPLVAETPKGKANPYLILGDMLDQAETQETASKDKAEYNNLITQKSEDSKK